MDAILLDFSKAFDKVPHQRLLSKLDFCCVCGKTQGWICDFLTNRTQQAVVEGERSVMGQEISGVPQGSVLGPTLFLAYVNDLCDNIKTKVRLFADYTILYNSIRNIADTARLQQDLDTLEKWENKWHMSFNVSKCNVLTITRKRELIVTWYTLQQQPVERVAGAKYLGVDQTGDFHWGKHIQATITKSNRTRAFVYQNLKGFLPQVHTHCYKGLVHPVLEYACVMWSPHQQNLSKSLEAIQHRSARRIIRDFRTTTSALSLISNLNFQPLEDRRTINKATFSLCMK